MKWILILLTSLFVVIACSKKSSEGERLYQFHCGPCHMEKGQGLKGLYPPLDQADYLDKNFDLLPCLIVKGIEGPIQVNDKTYDIPMAGITSMNPVEMANVINYINESFLKNPRNYTSPESIESILSNCQDK